MTLEKTSNRSKKVVLGASDDTFEAERAPKMWCRRQSALLDLKTRQKSSHSKVKKRTIFDTLHFGTISGRVGRFGGGTTF